jgi:hypothetical protein
MGTPIQLPADLLERYPELVSARNYSCTNSGTSISLQKIRFFALRYLWCSLRHGYTNNPYEADARAFAARRLAEPHLPA